MYMHLHFQKNKNWNKNTFSLYFLTEKRSLDTRQWSFVRCTWSIIAGIVPKYKHQYIKCYCLLFLISDEHVVCLIASAGFTYRLDRLKPRVCKFMGSPSKEHNIFDTVIGLSYICCILNNPSVIFLTQLHSILEYCRL